MRCRRQERIPLRVRILVSGVDRNGHEFCELADTVDLSTLGARLSGVRASLDTGAIVSVVQGDRCARFRVTWVGQPGTPTQGQIGLDCVEVAANGCKRILYLDDQEHELAARASLLRTAGYEVVTVTTLDGAWQELLKSRFDLLLLDFPVPEFDATAVVQSIRTVCPDLRIAITTTIPAAMPESLLASVDEWIHKGVLPGELLNRVATLIGQGSRLNWPVARYKPRYFVNVRVLLRIFRNGAPKTIEGRSIDLSSTGMGLELDEPVVAGEVGTATFRLPCANIEFSPRVMVRRKHRSYYGLEFVGMSASEVKAISEACRLLPEVTAPVEV